MDTKQLAKIIKVIVEKEISTQLPALIKEGVQRELKRMNVEPTIARKPMVEEEVDPFSLADSILDEDRRKNKKPAPKKQYTSNPVINEILNNTKPFGAANQINEGYDSMNKTISMDSNLAAGGLDALRSQMAAKMGYGDMAMGSGASPGGLGVNTEFDHINKALNRDYSALVKRFKK